MSETPADDLPPRPVTGNHVIDAALDALDLGDDVHTHPEAIATALAALQQALNPPAPPAGLPGPRP